MNPHLFFADPNLVAFLNADPDPAVFLNADPDPAVFLNADPDPAAFLMRIRIQLKQICNNFALKSILKLKNTKRLLKRKNHGAGPNLL